MQRRTFESPMDWEYQGTGPVDVTSPFTQLSRDSTHNGFSSPTKPQAHNPFSSQAPLSTPTKQQVPRPPSSMFTPRIPGSAAAPPFRNPAFTTPRKPFDDLALSEASGAETSPALTEPSDCPGDTPELDRLADLNMATITPSRIDKALRYGKSGAQLRRHAPGRGEIPRPGKDYSAVDYARKRKRRNQDADIAGLRPRHLRGGGWEGTDDSDSDGSGAGDGFAPRSRDRRRSRKNAGGGGWLSGVSRAMSENPDFSEQAHKLIRLSLHLILVGSFMFIGWKGYSAVHADIATANRAAQAARLNKIAECTKAYQENQCVQKLPALRQLCEEWKDCMTDDPEAIFMVRNTIKEVASIINEFSGEMHLKSWGFFFLAMILLILSNRMAVQRIENSKPSVQPHMAGPYPSAAPMWAAHGGPGEYPPWMHAQTPRGRRHMIEMDDASETETDDGHTAFTRSIMAPPQTPSRRSPRKEERARSPVKLGRSPTKLYH
ncbi:uncharacterized protein DNG_09997 [Cephalotrichum gorgonifer]|uniref:Brl1/Brr6 domain-containing protein n=1 Tax=Cephalotrichum gorgonifer TaxID=2041049 RepID=A0AAE8SZX8_9PEZI|nr:uncharacterized protein DNG_09997 [Cephalotrichum gorgonifer]